MGRGARLAALAQKSKVASASSTAAALPSAVGVSGQKRKLVEFLAVPGVTCADKNAKAIVAVPDMAKDKSERDTSKDRIRSVATPGAGSLHPEHRELFDMAEAIDLGLMSVRSRHEFCSIDQVRCAVELKCQRSFTEYDFSKVVYMFPKAYVWKFIRARNQRGSFCDLLHIKMDRRGLDGGEGARNGLVGPSAAHGDKILRHRRHLLLAIAERCSRQNLKIFPAQLKNVGGPTADTSTNSGDVYNRGTALPSRMAMKSVRRRGPLKISDVLPNATAASLAKHRKKVSHKTVQALEQLTVVSMLPTVCQAVYTEFNMQDKDTLVIDDKFMLKIACSIRGTIKPGAVMTLIHELVRAVPGWCSLTNIGKGATAAERLAFRVNRDPQTFLQTFKVLMKRRQQQNKHDE